MPLQQAKVKSVLSGDTLVLHSVHNVHQERILSLAFVSAPRLRREGDEPFAFESRDFIRRLLVGKVIQFQVLYTIPTAAKREHGVVLLQGGQSLPAAAVAEGWLKLRDDAGRRDDSEETKAMLEKLELQEAKAKADSKGLWATAGGKLITSYEIPDPKAFVEEWRGQSVEAIVERVLSGDRMIIRLMVTPTKHVQTMVLVAGIRAPTTKRTNPSDGKEQLAEPFGEEAHQFVESRLLQRTVKVDVLGVNPQGQLVCAVKHPNGSIAEFVLKAGLARCTDFHSTMLGADMGILRQAEKHAKDKKLGLFQGHVPTKGPAGDIEAVVTRVQTADTVYIRNKSGIEKRVGLSSVRQPKPTDPKQSPFSADAKEFLRKKLIGKHVRVTIDGKKPASEGFEEREVVTIVQGNKNIALLLVEAGYASVIRHRRDDEDRSPFYDDLVAAEEVAQKEEKGMWSPKPPASKTYQDYSENLQKAKVQSSVLQRQKKIPAVVDFVKSGSRFTVLVPRENAKLTFVLSGIRAPRSARNPNEQPEPFGQEAHDFANRRCMQRDVEIDVEGTDKVGGFIGALYINRENFAKLLLEEGLATVHAYSAEQSGSATELFAAEKKAKEARKGVWHDWDPSKEAADDDVDTAPINGTNGTPTTNGDSPAPTQRKLDYRDVLVTHIDPSNLHLKLQLIGHGTSALTTLMSSFRALHLSPNSPSPLSSSSPPKTGDLVAAQFSEDGEWYRAKVRRNDREKKEAEVVYIDYGNSENLPWNKLRPLTQPQFSTQTLKPQAVDAVLSFLQFPDPTTSKEYVDDAVAYLTQKTADKRLVANVDHTAPPAEGATLSVTLLEADSKGIEDSVNAEVVGEGLAMVGRKLKAWERAVGEMVGQESGEKGKGKEKGESVLEGLRRREAEAREGRRGMWEYGDLSTED